MTSFLASVASVEPNSLSTITRQTIRHSSILGFRMDIKALAVH